MNDMERKRHAKAIVLLAQKSESLKAAWRANRVFTALLIVQMAVIMGLALR